ncbi:MAG TPA: M48 family metallopeptidase [Beijerinckiaceae bacterium]
MAEAAPAIFYDGATAKPRPVALRFEPDALAIVEGGAVAARWPYDGIRRLSAGAGPLRVKSLSGAELARLEVEDEAAAAELVRRSPKIEEGTVTDRRTLLRIVGWSLAAAASLVVTAIYLVPVAADLLAPLIPVSVERRIGEAVDNQVRSIFGGEGCRNERGAAALAKLSGQLVSRASLPMPAEVRVLDSRIPNAVALPGGRVYLFEGLLRRANDPDEVAGVLAHELGHVAHRDGMRRMIQAGGSSFLLGRALVDTSYSREAETAADRFAADLVTALGRSPRPMGAFLVRLTGSGTGVVPPFLSSHPVSAARLEALKVREVPVTGAPLLTEEEWRDLKSICKAG